MKKNYRKIPFFITEKIREAESPRFEVASVKKIYKSDLKTKDYSSIGISLSEDETITLETVLPNEQMGKYSKKNKLGWMEIHKEAPKIYKNINLGERPIFGDWEKGSFLLIQRRKVYQKTYHAPKNKTITPILIEDGIDEKGQYSIVKIKVNNILELPSPNFESELLEDINILYESNKNVNIFHENTSIIDYISSISVDWTIFPPGKIEEDLKKIIGKRKNLPLKDQEEIKARYDFIRSLKPLRFIKGLGSSNSYFGAIIKENLVIFENIKYGNAIYVLFEDWVDISKLSRSEIKRKAYEHKRIIHSKRWKVKLLNFINSEQIA